MSLSRFDRSKPYLDFKTGIDRRILRAPLIEDWTGVDPPESRWFCECCKVTGCSCCDDPLSRYKAALKRV